MRITNYFLLIALAGFFLHVIFFVLDWKDSGGKIVFEFAREYRVGRSLWVSLNVSVCVCMFVCMEKGKHL